MRPPPEYRLPIDTRRIRRFILRLVIFVVLLVGAFESISFYVESLWFDSLGYASVFWYRLRLEGLVFLIFAAASAFFLWLLFRLVMPATSYTRRVEIGGEAIILPSAESLRGLASPIAIIVGIFFGLSFGVDWNDYGLFLNQPSASSVADPILGHPLSFYFFTLPVMQSIASWLLAISVIGLVA